MWRWLVRDWQWPAAAVFVSVFLLAIAPPFVGLAGTTLALVYVQLPVYLLHQGEEHIGDRFRLHINRMLGGREALTPAATFWINALGVWAYNLLAMYLAWVVEPSAGLASGYLSVVNGVVHLVPAVVRWEYNPRLVTAVLLLLPVGGWCVAQIGASAGLLPHAVGLAAAIGVHAVIIIYLLRRLVRLPKPVEPVAALEGG